METSPSIAALAKALAAFQGEATNPPKTRTAVVEHKNGGKHSYNYADLSDIITAVKAGMKKHGLSVVQSAVSTEQGIGVSTMLTHESGEWVKSDPLILPLRDATPQAAGSAVTYARRYALSAILGISTEEDDDAGIAEDHQKNRPQAVRPQPAPQPAPQTAKPTENGAPSGSVSMPFGKHEGKALKDIDTNYLSWLAKNLVDPKYNGKWDALRADVVAVLAEREFNQTRDGMGTEVADEGAQA
jgi:hypothetical protein